MDALSTGLTAGFDPDVPLRRAPEPWASLPMPAVREAPPWAMSEMIAAGPAVAARIVTRLAADGSASRLAHAVDDTARRGAPIVLTGCGTSEHAAMAAARILADALRATGVPSAAVASAQALELALDPPRGGLVIGVSHEGGTAATIAALEAARAAGGGAALLTASAGSPAAAAADLVVETAELDASWCHTVGYVSPIVGAAAVGAALTSRGAGFDGTALGAALRACLSGGIAAAGGFVPVGGTGPADAMAAMLADVSVLLVVGSGADIPAARELALKVEEGAQLPATARELETFLHGHLAATDATTGLVLILADQAARHARVRRAVQALRAASVVGIRAGAILAAGAAAAIPEDLTPAGRIVIAEAPDLPGPVAALLASATPLQLLTERLARARGTNPDPIRRDDPRYLAAADAADAVEPDKAP